MSAALAKKIDSANRSHLAGELGVNRSYLSRVLSGQRGMSLDLALRLGRKFGVRVEDLAGYLGSKRESASVVNYTN